MRLIPVAAALAVVATALSGCASLSGGQGSDATVQLLNNLRHCARTYTGGVGGLAPPAATVHIDCPAEPYAAPAPASPAP